MPNMQVLILCLPRTGTQSLADALIHLGISPVYHMREVAINGHQDTWTRAIADNLPASSPRAPWSPDEWRAFLDSYAAVSDFPPALFPTALGAAYPDCPVILSTRSFESWAASMRDTLIHGHLHRDPAKKSPMAGLAAAYHSACWDDDFEANGRAYFERHHAEVRALAKDGRRFLEHHPGDGWGPLCEFLGIEEVPDVPFPRSDDWVEYKKMVEKEREEKKAREAAGITEGN